MQVIGAVGRQRCAGDARGAGGEAAVVDVYLDNRGAVGVEQCQGGVCAAGGKRGHCGRIDAVAGVTGEGEVIQVGDRPDVAVDYYLRTGQGVGRGRRAVGFAFVKEGDGFWGQQGWAGSQRLSTHPRHKNLAGFYRLRLESFLICLRHLRRGAGKGQGKQGKA